MPGSVLVDSSYFIDRLRAGEDPFAHFAEHADDTDFFTCGVVMVEVLRGVKIKKAHTRLSALMGAMLYVPTLNRVWERVAALAWQLDRAGLPTQVTDLTIAACALDADAAVLTLDSDFARVPGLRVVRTLG
ncbi:MAG: PIN domain-containing protein [Chthoniobacteraceae bacterium]